jgi:hypothetical protein
VDADHPRDRPWGYLATIGAIAIVGVLLLVVPGMLVPKAPVSTPTPRPSPTPEDPHVVVTEAGTIVFGFETGEIVIRRTVDGVETELARVPVPEAQHPVASGDPLHGAGAYAMVCAADGASGPERFLFGYVEPGTGITYRGPTALGQGAPDGLFLFALPPGDIDPEARFEVGSDAASLGLGARSFERALTEGDEQPSGCRVRG